MLVCCFGISSGGSRVLEWDDLKEYALSENSEIMRAYESLHQARLSYRSSAYEFRPDFTLSAHSGFETGGDSRTSLDISAGYDFTLFRGGRARSGLLISSYRLEAETLRYESRLRSVLYRLRLDFGEVLRAREEVEVTRDRLRRVRSNLEIVELRYEAGREDRGALMRSEADIAREEHNLSVARRRLEKALADLFITAGIDPPDGTEVEGTLETGAVPEEENFSAYAVSHPDYLAEIYSHKVALQEVESARGTLYPALTFSARAGRSGTDPVFGDSSWNAGVSLRFPFFSSGRDLRALDMAESRERVARRGLEDTARDLENDIREAYLDYTDAAENLEVVKMYYEASRERARIAVEKYLNGLISYYEWDSIERDLMNAGSSLTAARSRLYAAAARWEMYTGDSAHARQENKEGD